MSGVDFRWNTPISSIIQKKVYKDGKTLLFMAETWQKLYDPFVPMDTGLLSHDAVSVYAEDGKGIIHHKAPYATAVYYGGEKNWRRDKHPLATAQWDEAAATAGKRNELTRSVEGYIKGGYGS